MDKQEKLVILKSMTEEKDDQVLSAYLKLAASKVLAVAYPYDKAVKEVPDCYAGHQIAIAAYFINKRGAEGETAHSENGVSRSYESADVPSSMLRDIVPMVGVIG